jgi:Plasmid pRiA4b ORF-3-like protein
MFRRHAATPTYVFRVRILGGFPAPPGARSIWREVELAADQTLADLGGYIPPAFGFDDDHLWSFFLSGKPWDRASEYARLPDPPGGRRKRGADDLRVRDAPTKKELLFLFDYGDEWHFGVKLARTGEVEPGARYPRVVASQGQAPPQYPELDHEDDWDEETTKDFLLPADALLPELAAPEFPPVELAPPPELHAAAAAAPTVRRLRALVEWLGEGRKLTAAGNLTVADGKELARLLGLVDPDRLAGMRVRSSQDIAGLELLLSWTKEIRLTRVHKGHLVAVKQHRRLLDDPLELFNRAASALPLLVWGLPLTDMIDSSFPGGLAEALVDLLSLLYAPEEPVTLDDLVGHVWEEHVEPLLDEQAASRLELWRLATAVETAQLLSHLQGLGMVEQGDERDAEPASVAAARDDGEEPGSPADAYLASLARLPLRLTPLGTWRANVLLRSAGAVAPVIGELAGTDAAALIQGVAGYDERAFQAELRAWCQERGLDAARELAGYARAAPGFEQRMLAFAALREAGPAAEAEVRAMLADPGLSPHAQLWLVEGGLEDAASLDPASAMLLMAETLASILDDGGPAGLVEHLGQLGPPAEQATVLADLWRARTPRAAAVLEAAGKAHPDPQVAKAARKAAFKLRSSGSPGSPRALS